MILQHVICRTLFRAILHADVKYTFTLLSAKFLLDCLLSNSKDVSVNFQQNWKRFILFRIIPPPFLSPLVLPLSLPDAPSLLLSFPGCSSLLVIYSSLSDLSLIYLFVAFEVLLVCLSVCVCEGLCVAGNLNACDSYFFFSCYVWYVCSFGCVCVCAALVFWEHPSLSAAVTDGMFVYLTLSLNMHNHGLLPLSVYFSLKLWGNFYDALEGSCV